MAYDSKDFSERQIAARGIRMLLDFGRAACYIQIMRI